MDLSNIIAMIDADLDRLRQVREIIASLATSPATEIDPSPAPQQIESFVVAPSAPLFPEANAEEAVVASPAPAVREAKKTRAPRSPKSRPAAPTTPRALGRPTDERPVFVSAKVLSLRSPGKGQAKEASDQGTAEKPSADVLTAKALAQRWISNPLLH